MRWSRLFLPTLKETPAEAETPSHQLMLRAGIIRKLASGIHTYLPAGLRVLEKISRIIREELNRIGAQELLMPVIHPAELWQQTGRWDKVEILFKLKDRAQRDFLLGPTHEEVITSLVAHEVKSYRNLPLLLYQIQTKFRDEPRPRGGVIRAREFIMMDLYSFHRTKEDLEKTYGQVYEAYVRIYKRCGFDIRIVEGDTGDIGGDISHQFELMTETGEDTLLVCSKCPFGADIWMVRGKEPDGALPKSASAQPEKIHTPHVKTIEDLVRFLGKSARDFVKTLLYDADGKLVAVCLRGDRDINELKLKKFLGAKKLGLASEARAEGLPLGFIGPVGLRALEVVADHEVKGMADAVCGANEPDHHLKNVTYGRDFSASRLTDLRMAVPGDPCPKCGAGLEARRGIELGQIFNLGTLYSQALGCTFLEEDGTEKPMIMGCYGIGVSRMAAALIEQHHDQDGIRWPIPVAPYDVVVVPVNTSVPAHLQAAEQAYGQLQEAGFETILDDRDVRAGVKFKDADLVGIPFRVTVGQKAGEGKLEIRIRAENRTLEIPISDLVSRLSHLREEAMKSLSPESAHTHI